MLTGRAPFQRETVAETMTAILKEEPSGLSDAEGGVTPGLDRIARHCLEKKADQRFQSASDIAFALDSLSVPSGASKSAPEPGGDGALAFAHRGTARFRGPVRRSGRTGRASPLFRA